MPEILILIAKIILIIANGWNAIDATLKVAEESGISFEALWACLPDIFKNKR